MAHQDLDPKGKGMGSGTFPKIITKGLWATKHLFLPDLFELCTNSEKNVFGCFQLLIPTPTRSPSLGSTRESLQSMTRFSASVWALHHCTGKIFVSHNKSLSINSEITKRPYLPEITIKESHPSNTTLLHKTLLALQKPSRIFCFASPT